MGKGLGREGGLSPCKSPGKDRRCRMHVRQGTEAIQSLLVIPLEPSPDGRNTIENTCKAPSRRQHGAATARVPLLCRIPQESSQSGQARTGSWRSGMRAARWTSRGSGWTVHGWGTPRITRGTYEYASSTPPSNKIPSPGTKTWKIMSASSHRCHAVLSGPLLHSPRGRIKRNGCI